MTSEIPQWLRNAESQRRALLGVRFVFLGLLIIRGLMGDDPQMYVTVIGGLVAFLVLAYWFLLQRLRSRMKQGIAEPYLAASVPYSELGAWGWRSAAGRRRAGLANGVLRLEHGVMNWRSTSRLEPGFAGVSRSASEIERETYIRTRRSIFRERGYLPRLFQDR